MSSLTCITIVLPGPGTVDRGTVIDAINCCLSIIQYEKPRTLEALLKNHKADQTKRLVVHKDEIFPSHFTELEKLKRNHRSYIVSGCVELYSALMRGDITMKPRVSERVGKKVNEILPPLITVATNKSDIVKEIDKQDAMQGYVDKAPQNDLQSTPVTQQHVSEDKAEEKVQEHTPTVTDHDEAISVTDVLSSEEHISKPDAKDDDTDDLFADIPVY